MGQKAVIVCNGPSLRRTNLELLQGVYSFGLNKIHLLFEQHTWRPSCIVAVNDFVIEQTAKFYNETSLPLFLNARSRRLIKFRLNTIFLHTSEQQRLAQDCSMSVATGATVTVVAMQLAFHMGFHAVALIGCDHSYTQKGPPHQAVVAQQQDSDHFDPRYFSSGLKWQLPDLKTSEYFYHLALEMFNNHNRRLVNCTAGGKLEILPRQHLHEFLALNPE